MEARSVHCVVTSPPYFGLRSYSGGAAEIGQEASPEQFVEVMVRVFREVHRVLRDDGTLWLNLGDSYANDGKWGGHTGGKHVKALHCSPIGRNKRYTGLKPKSLIGIPWRVALALQADGWILRQEIIWNKTNAMPESVRDRPTCAHEQIFLFSKRPHYFYDSEAIAEPSAEDRYRGASFTRGKTLAAAEASHRVSRRERIELDTRNKRSVWSVGVGRYRGAHFATFPPPLIEPCILAGTSSHGCCSFCGAPWKRVTRRSGELDARRPQSRRALEIFEQAGLTPAHAQALRAVGLADAGQNRATMSGTGRNASEVQRLANEAKSALNGYAREFLLGRIETDGWKPNCRCQNADAPMPCTVLDPFSGAGTTALVALQHGRRAVGIELNPRYIAIAEQRIQQNQGY